VIAFLQLIVALIVIPTTAHARFLHTDADEIDQEETYNSESFNDAKAYEFPAYWNDFWMFEKLGYRITFGSLNANKFLVDEDLKLVSSSNYPVTFSFEHHRYDDLLERRLNQELRLIGGYETGVYAALTAEGGHFKRHGDMGGAFGWRFDPKSFVELYYTKVDLFYNVKQDLPGSSYIHEPWTVGVRWQQIDSVHHWWTASVEYDAPLLREDKQLSQDYRYQNQVFSLAWTQTMSLGIWRGNIRGEKKTEARNFYTQDFHKKMYRIAGVIDQSLEFAYEGMTMQPGILLVARRAEYDYRGVVSDPEKKPREGDDPDIILRSPDSYRREYMPYVVARHDIDPKVHLFQYGLYAANVEISESGKSSFSNEVKWQFAYEFRFSEKSYVLVNTAWDLDNMTTDFPYDKGIFRPWDGGNVQFYAVF
jgi:hypothetical protein